MATVQALMADYTAHTNLIRLGTRRAPVALTKAVRDTVVIAHDAGVSYLLSLGIASNSDDPNILDLDSVRTVARECRCISSPCLNVLSPRLGAVTSTAMKDVAKSRPLFIKQQPDERREERA